MMRIASLLTRRRIGGRVVGAIGALGVATIFGLENISQTQANRRQPIDQADTRKYDFNWDLNGKADGRNTRYVVFVRHGQYNRARNDEERTLTPLGKEQAKETGKRLKALFDAGKLPPLNDLIYSTMTRATETAEIILGELDPLTNITNNKTINSNTNTTTTTTTTTTTNDNNNNNNENKKGNNEAPYKKPPAVPASVTPEILIEEAAVCKPEPPHPSWSMSDREFLVEGAQAHAGFVKHMQRAEKGKAEHTSLFVCHGNIIRFYVMKLLQLPPEAWLRTVVANGSITVVSIRPNGGCSLFTFGNSGHLEPEQVTYN